MDSSSLKQLQKSPGNKAEKVPSEIYVIFLILIFDLLGFTVILPLLPSIFEYYGSNEKDYMYHFCQNVINKFQDILGCPDIFNNVLFGGILGSLFSGLQFLVAPIYGSLSDVYGRKPIFILSTIGIGLSHAVWCLSDHFYLFVIARIIGGLSRANISLSTAIVTDLCSEKNRGKGMALIGIAFGLGFIVGPMIGAAFASRSLELTQNFFLLPALFALSMSVIDIVLLCFCFKESLPKEKRASSIGQGLTDTRKYINPAFLFSFRPVTNIGSEDRKCLQRLGLIYFLFLFIYSGLEYSLSFLTHTRFNFSRMQQGKMYLFSGVIMLLVQGGYTRRIPAGKEARSAVIGAILIIPAFILIGVSRSLEVFYFGLALYAYASATVVPCLTTLVSKFGSSSQKGVALGIFRSLGSLARAFGPVVFAIAYWSLTPSVSYCIGALLLIVPLIMMISLNKKLPKRNL